MPRSERTDDDPGAGSSRPRSARRPRTIAIRLLAIAGLVFLLFAGGAAPTGDRPAEDRPVVFAHYFPPYPLSLDNRATGDDYYTRNYLTPFGEDNLHAGYGGLLRDRPQPVQPRGGDWRERNLRTEIDQAKSAGIDGFMIDLLSPSGSNWEAGVNLMRAADEAGGFVVVPMIDATAPFAQLEPSVAADRIAELLRHRSAYRTDRGYLLSSFATERMQVDWWRQVITDLEDRHRMPISFQAVFLNAGPQHMVAFRTIADGFGYWGTRTAESVRAEPDFAAQAHGLGKTWMAPVAVQDFRPRSVTYAEASNTATLRTMWTDAIHDGADLVQLVTWNDYSESTHFAPSQAHGSCFVDLSRYYSTWFRHRHRPDIQGDAIYLTHRIQRAGAEPTYPHQLAQPNLGDSRTEPRDQVEVVTMLSRPAIVHVAVGGRTTSYRAEAGLSVRTRPLEVGSVSTELRRDDRAVLSVTSPHRVVARPYVQDMQYYAACAQR